MLSQNKHSFKLTVYCYYNVWVPLRVGRHDFPPWRGGQKYSCYLAECLSVVLKVSVSNIKVYLEHFISNSWQNYLLKSMLLMYLKTPFWLCDHVGTKLAIFSNQGKAWNENPSIVLRTLPPRHFQVSKFHNVDCT